MFRLCSLQSVEWLIVDESDKLFEKGASKLSFRDQLGQIYSACNNPKIRRAMFSATFAYDVQQWCILNMDNVLQVGDFFKLCRAQHNLDQHVPRTICT